MDQRTLAFSMSPGGWIHPNVMDCFGYMITLNQLYKLNKGIGNKDDILIHVVIKEARVSYMFLNLVI